MGGSYFGQALSFLVDILFDLYILAVLLRFLLQWVRADFYNPLSQALVTLTNPPLRPLRRLIPGLFGIDLAAVLLMLVLEAVKLLLLGLIRGVFLQPAGLLVLALAELLQLVFWVMVVALFVRAILSWIAPAAGYNPVGNLLVRLTEPLMRPARRLMPPVGGLDMSMIVVFIVLWLAYYLILLPLRDLGFHLAV